MCPKNSLRKEWLGKFTIICWAAVLLMSAGWMIVEGIAAIK